MILYMDTSSLVKLYVEEPDSSRVERLVQSVDAAATSVVAYAEARAAFARRYRENAFTADEYDRIKAGFDRDWPDYFVLYTTQELIRLAGDLAEKHALRGLDAIHLASAVVLKQESAGPVVFSCFDANVEKAAILEGLSR